ncbi:DUF202 domain-containing protein [Bifidobacterium simiarum]|uniref:DUF202 domain-containing protein n=1 Tax=Bifidobacterium simiarum TaxID=2045441 RepID=UPI001BDCD1A2|nr:DUF202 domain-containing protein [Bifidobacterium simiarum]MBT1166021.1 DUF202 domain-containing protein [Bifidobacterium simiarum]
MGVKAVKKVKGIKTDESGDVSHVDPLGSADPLGDGNGIRGEWAPYPPDPGLQLERTILSWRRTLLSGAVLTAGVLKLTDIISWGWDVIIVVIAAFALWMPSRFARFRRRAWRRFILDSDSQSRNGGIIPMSVLPWNRSLALSLILSIIAIMMIGDVLWS